MATSSFDRKFEISDPNSIRRFNRIIEKGTKQPKKTPTATFTAADRIKSEQLLKQVLSR